MRKARGEKSQGEEKDMTTEERMELGAKFKREMNCCLAVVKAFADTVDVDEATLMRLASGFGSGMGTMEGTCGARVGAIMIASLCPGNLLHALYPPRQVLT